MPRPTTVSYTHLDVYKRQHPWFTAQFADGSVYTEDFNRTGYGRGFGMQLFLRPACARCRYTSTSRPADFTLADYWGLDLSLIHIYVRGKPAARCAGC